MRFPILVSLCFSLAAFGADDRSAKLSPVLRPLEPAETGTIRLPGPARTQTVEAQHAPAQPLVAPRYRTVKVQAPVPRLSPLATRLQLTPLPLLPQLPKPLPEAPEMPLGPIPVPARLNLPLAAVPPARPAIPADAARELGSFCQNRIGVWTEAEAGRLLGTPVRNRPAYDEAKRENGRILAYRDPTTRYRELELDFDAATGLLRTVFLYPRSMTYQEVRKKWDGDVSATDAPQGRKFYSYSNRHLDVLVDSSGRVISLGLY